MRRNAVHSDSIPAPQKEIHMIRLEQVTQHDRIRRVLKRISLTINAGELVVDIDLVQPVIAGNCPQQLLIARRKRHLLTEL